HRGRGRDARRQLPLGSRACLHGGGEGEYTTDAGRSEWDTCGVPDLVASATALESAEGQSRLVELAGEADITSLQLKDVLDAEVGRRPRACSLGAVPAYLHGFLGTAHDPGGRAEAARLGGNAGHRCPFRGGPADAGAVRGRHSG